MKKVQKFILLAAICLFFIKCNNQTKHKENAIKSVGAAIETESVVSEFGEDAADDPSIYIHPDGADKSWIIGTNKKAGLCVYNLIGKEIYFTPVGLVNNVDIRYGFELGNGEKVDLVAASNRTDNSLTLLKINVADTTLDSILVENVISSVDEVYGCCMYHNKASNQYYTLINGKDGNIEQYELLPSGENKIEAKLVKTYSVSSQPEGMVADDYNQTLYVGEEDKGVWRFDLKTQAEPVFVQNSDTLNTNIAFDIEGLTIFYGSEPNSGYLIASSQGNFSYAIYERMPPNNYIGSFKISDSNYVDGVQETDGIDVINHPLDDNFAHGMFVAQDGFNYEGDSLQTQNFKYVKWEDIAQKFTPELIIE